jgi:hypothetical protein
VSFLSATEMQRCVPLCREDAHEMGVVLSETEMERCVPLSKEDAHEMGVSFEMKHGAHVMGLLFSFV